MKPVVVFCGMLMLASVLGAWLLEQPEGAAAPAPLGAAPGSSRLAHDPGSLPIAPAPSMVASAVAAAEADAVRAEVVDEAGAANAPPPTLAGAGRGERSRAWGLVHDAIARRLRDRPAGQREAPSEFTDFVKRAALDVERLDDRELGELLDAYLQLTAMREREAGRAGDRPELVPVLESALDGAQDRIATAEELAVHRYEAMERDLASAFARP